MLTDIELNFYKSETAKKVNCVYCAEKPPSPLIMHNDNETWWGRAWNMFVIKQMSIIAAKK